MKGTNNVCLIRKEGHSGSEGRATEQGGARAEAEGLQAWDTARGVGPCCPVTPRGVAPGPRLPGEGQLPAQLQGQMTHGGTRTLCPEAGGHTQEVTHRSRQGGRGKALGRGRKVGWESRHIVSLKSSWCT